MSVSEDDLDRMRTRAADVTARVQQMTAQLDELSQQVKAISVTATSADRLITVTVASDGRLTRLELDRDVYQHHDPDELARQIEEVISVAAAEAQQRMIAACESYVPADQLRAALAHDFRSLVHGISQEHR